MQQQPVVDPVIEIIRLPETGYLRIGEVLRFIPVSATTWWQGVKTGRYPKSIKLSRGVTAWRAEDIRSLIEEIGNED